MGRNPIIEGGKIMVATNISMEMCYDLDKLRGRETRASYMRNLLKKNITEWKMHIEKYKANNEPNDGTNPGSEDTPKEDRPSD